MKDTSHFILSLLVATALLVPLTILGPLSLLALNSNEFSTHVLELVPYLWVHVLLLILITCLFVLIPKPVQTPLLAFVTILNVLFYLHGNLIVWDYGPLNGEDIKWGAFTKQRYVDLVIWLSTFTLAVIYYKHFSTKLKAFNIFLLLIYTINLAYTIKAAEARIFPPQATKELEPIYSFSKEKNVIMILMDAFQSPAFKEIIKSNPEYQEIFNGFTYFPDTLASFTSTNPSIPAILSGVEYLNSVPMNEYLKTHLVKSIPMEFKAAGYQSDVVSLPQFCQYFSISNCSYLAEIANAKRANLVKAEALELLDISLFRHAPHFLKRAIYNQQSWLFQQLIHKESGSAIHLNSRKFVEQLTDKMNNRSSIPTFKFFHLLIPHSPFRLSPECRSGKIPRGNAKNSYLKQTRCGLHLVNMIFEKLKENGIFDNSLIVVLADHGTSNTIGGLEKIKGWPRPNIALPLLLIKPFNADTEKPMLESAAQARIADLPRTITEIANLGDNVKFPGENLFSLDTNSKRSRFYFHYHWDHKYWRAEYLPELHQYIVNGNAWLQSSWAKGKSYKANN